MADRPILFSGPMVRALLAGTKTQTRRVAKFIEPIDDGEWHIHNAGGGVFGVEESAVPDAALDFAAYDIGDRLWVKERLHRDPDLWKYFADGAEVGWPARQPLASKRLDYAPSIHMPKVASRLTLKVTDVRVQRLQDISAEDATAEGYEDDGVYAHSRDWYASLWDSLNADRPGCSWFDNPWVVAVSFVVVFCNIDEAA